MEQIFKQLGYIRKINEKTFRDRGYRVVFKVAMSNIEKLKKKISDSIKQKKDLKNFEDKEKKILRKNNRILFDKIIKDDEFQKELNTLISHMNKNLKGFEFPYKCTYEEYDNSYIGRLQLEFCLNDNQIKNPEFIGENRVLATLAVDEGFNEITISDWDSNADQLKFSKNEIKKAQSEFISLVTNVISKQNFK